MENVEDKEFQKHSVQHEIFNKICAFLKIIHLTNTVSHPQTNGDLERSHKTLIMILEITRIWTI